MIANEDIFIGTLCAVIAIILLYVDYYIFGYHQQGNYTKHYIKAHLLKHLAWAVGYAFFVWAGRTSARFAPVFVLVTFLYIVLTQALAMMAVKNRIRIDAGLGASHFQRGFESTIETVRGMKRVSPNGGKKTSTRENKTQAISE